jgi:hypothetical protein
LGHLGSAAEFAMADDANRSMAAPAIDGNRSLSRPLGSDIRGAQSIG